MPTSSLIQSVAINYNGVGSGAGKTAIIANTVDFAGSDSLLSDQNYTDGKDLQMYPMVAGAVVPVYNIAFKPVPTPAAGATALVLPKLILDRQTLVIFTIPRSRCGMIPRLSPSIPA